MGVHLLAVPLCPGYERKRLCGYRRIGYPITVAGGLNVKDLGTNAGADEVITAYSFDADQAATAELSIGPDAFMTRGSAVPGGELVPVLPPLEARGALINAENLLGANLTLELTIWRD